MSELGYFGGDNLKEGSSVDPKPHHSSFDDD